MSKYKYNDYTLPGLPAGWSPITYPYAVIIHGTGTDDPANAFKFWLVCSGEEFTALNVNGTNCVAIKPYTVVHQFLYIRGEEEWVWEDKGTLVVDDMDSQTEGDLLYYYFNPTKTEYIWCNEDIKNTSGTVIFEGSEPVLVEADPEEPEEPEVTETRDLRSYCLGIALELIKKALPISKAKPPIAYLYNGVQLPPLPEWDREMYPYAWLLDCGRVSWSNFRVYELYVLGKPSTRTEFGILTLPAPWNRYDLNVYDDERITEWEVGSPCYIDHHLKVDPIWTNHDILNEDGSVYLEASDPIPVYE